MKLINLVVKDVDGLPKYASLSKWFLRLAVLVYISTIYWRRLVTLNFESDYFLIAIFYVLFSIMLFVGGFQKRATLTRFSGLALVVLTIVYFGASIVLHKNLHKMFTDKILLLAVALYFATSSNWREYKRRRKIKKDPGLEDKTDEEIDEEEHHPVVLH
jgi:hypothetical protein